MKDWQEQFWAAVGTERPSEQEMEELLRCEYCGTSNEDTVRKECPCNRAGCVNVHCAGCDNIRYGFGPAGCPL